MGRDEGRPGFQQVGNAKTQRIAEVAKNPIWSFTGHLRSVSGLGVPATGRPVTITGLVLYRVADGAIAEMWEELDRLRALQQMGAVAAPAPPLPAP